MCFYSVSFLFLNMIYGKFTHTKNLILDLYFSLLYNHSCECTQGIFHYNNNWQSFSYQCGASENCAPINTSFPFLLPIYGRVEKVGG